MRRINKKYFSASQYYIPSFFFDRNTMLYQNKKHIYGINNIKKSLLICNSNFNNQMYLSFYELEKINSLIKENIDGNNM